jgi:hypothetical protein
MHLHSRAQSPSQVKSATPTITRPPSLEYNSLECAKPAAVLTQRRSHPARREGSSDTRRPPSGLEAPLLRRERLVIAPRKQARAFVYRSETADHPKTQGGVRPASQRDAVEWARRDRPHGAARPCAVRAPYDACALPEPAARREPNQGLGEARQTESALLLPPAPPVSKRLRAALIGRRSSRSCARANSPFRQDTNLRAAFGLGAALVSRSKGGSRAELRSASMVGEPLDKRRRPPYKPRHRRASARRPR